MTDTIDLRFRIKVEPPDPITEALVVIQCGRPLPPRLVSRDDLVELGRNPVSPAQQQVKELLRPLNYQNRSGHTLDMAAASIHLACAWAQLYRLGSGMQRSRHNHRLRVVAWQRTNSIKHELRLLLEALERGKVVPYAQRVAALSPAAFDLVLDAATAKKIRVESPPHLLDRARMHSAVFTALEAVHRRPRMPAHDAAVRVIRAVFEHLTGIAGRRAIGAPGRREVGRPTSELHRLVLEISGLYGLALVSPAADDRLRSPRR